MAKQKLSRYRQHARELIAGVLDTLPPGATRRNAEKAITAVNPYTGGFSGDGHCWARQCWSRERVAALKRRFPEAKVKEAAATVAYVLGTSGGAITAGRYPVLYVFWPGVRCDWCKGQVTGGCLQCMGHIAHIQAIVATPEFRSIHAEVVNCPEAIGVLTDWLKEQGIDVEVRP